MADPKRIVRTNGASPTEHGHARETHSCCSATRIQKQRCLPGILGGFLMARKRVPNADCESFPTSKRRMESASAGVRIRDDVWIGAFRVARAIITAARVSIPGNTHWCIRGYTGIYPIRYFYPRRMGYE
jgi:hypothetical protein